MNIPTNIKYTESHEWIKVNGNEAFVGITDFAQNELGDIVFLDVDSEGETFQQGEEFGAIEATKTVADVKMPVDGEVLEVNEKAKQDGSIINKDPYGEGWIIRIKMNNPAQVEGLLDAAAYEKIMH
ncbi:MAG: glycine cleavage system protein GcvH [Bacteroidales bacterium]|nr:glycine cleavage system protein GcvH [Bacteroidales bacterium]